MKRLLFALVVACGPAPAPSRALAIPPHPAAFACPSALPSPKTDAKAASALPGKPIDHVCILGASGETLEAATPVLSTKVGTTLDPARIHGDLVALLDLPMVDDAAVYASRGQSGLVVYFDLRERPFVADVSFEGVHAFTHEELLKVPLAVGQRFDVRALRTFAKVFREAYASRGYGGAKVDYQATAAAPGKMRVVITVDEGLRWKFGPLVFSGQKTLSKTDLTKAVGFASGDPWNADVLDRASVLVQALEYDRGLVEGKVDVSHGDPGPDGAVPVTFTLREGDVFRIGKLRVTNVPPATEKQLLAAMKTRPRTIFSRATLVSDMTAIRGKLGKGVTPLTNIDPHAKTVDVVFEVE